MAVFLKEPRPGRVKTRLARAIGKRRAAGLYRAFVVDTLEWFGRTPAGERRLYYAPEGTQPERIARLVPGGITAMTLWPQRGAGLGERLERAFEETFAAGFRAAVVTGTDCPLVGPSTLRQALSALENAEVVLGPARDGGYYLVGLRRFAPEIFRGIPWSTSRVLAATLESIRRAGLTTALLEPLGDVDTLADLVHLKRELVELWRQSRGGHFPRRTFRELAYMTLR